MTHTPRLPPTWHAQHITLQCGYGTAIMGTRQFRPGDKWHCLGCGMVDEKVVAAKMATVKEQEELSRVEQ